MKKHLVDIIIGIVFVVGLGILLYPAISNYINEKHSTKVIRSYSDVVENTGSDELEKILNDAEVYNRKLSEKPEAFYNPDIISGYKDVLDITGSGIMGYIDIKKIGVELPIYHGVEKEVLQVGVGHIPGTSLPIGGESTHSVLSGHRGLPSAKLFTDLDKLEIGDTFTIIIHEDVLTYQVDQIKIVLPTETDDLKIIEGKDFCTLLTCTPYGVNSHRLLVRGRRIDNPEQKKNIRVSNEALRIDPVLVASIVAVPLLIIVFAIVIIYDRSKAKKGDIYEDN